MRNLLFLGFIFVCFVFHSQNKITRLYKKSLPAVVKISVIHSDGTSSEGTGFFIDPKTIVSCHHVLFSINNIRIETKDGKIFTADSVLASNQKADLVKFTVKEKNKSWLKLAHKNPLIGESLYLISNPDDFDFSMSGGMVAGIRKKGNVELIQHTASSSGGSSGGPIFTKRGKVVGIVSFIKFSGQNLNFAVSSTEILNMKDDNTIDHIIPELTHISKGEIDSLYLVAKSFFNKKDYSIALNTILPLIKHIKDTSNSIKCLEMIADCHFYKLDFAKASQYYEHLVKFLYAIKKKKDEHVYVLAETLYKESLCRFGLTEFQGAVDILSQLKEICKAGIEHDSLRKETYTWLIQKTFATDALAKNSLGKVHEACISWKIAKQYGYEKNDNNFDEICK